MPPKTAGRFGPVVYAAWRGSSLGEIVETLEYRLMFRMIGPLADRSVLDVGCGDGTFALACAETGTARVAACDADPRMIVRARDQAERHGVPLSLAVATAQSLPFADASFDVVTCVTVLTFIADPLPVLREIARVLRPGGRLLIGDLNRWSVWAARRWLRGWFGAALWRSARFRDIRRLTALSRAAGLDVEAVGRAIYFPPVTALARVMASLDPSLGRIGAPAAAFVAVLATKAGDDRTGPPPAIPG
jgi:SAM-dependent methyltransferase